MSAQANHTVWSAYLSPTTGTVARGKCMSLDADGDYYEIATLAARTASGRGTAIAGIARTPGDSDNRAIEIQTVGPCEPHITQLGDGVAGFIIVNDDGDLERKPAPDTGDIVCGLCDTDGWAYLNFSSTTGSANLSVSGTGFVRVVGGVTQSAASAVNLAGGSTHVTGVLPVANGGTGLSAPGTSGNVLTSNGSAWVSSAPAATSAPGAPDKSDQYRVNSTTFGGMTGWTYEGSGRRHASESDDAHITYGAALGATYGSTGMWRVPAVPGEGDPIPLISGADGTILQLEGGGYTLGNSSVGLTFVADSASGVTFNTGLGTVAFDGSVTVGQTVTAEDVAVNNDLTVANDAEVTGNLTVDGDINGSVVNLTTEIVSPEVNCTSIFVQQGAVIAGVATKSERLPVVRTSSTTPLATTIHTMVDETVVAVEMTVVMARRTNVTKAARYKQTVTYRRTGGGVATQVGAAITDTAQETTAGDDAIISTDGTTGITAVVTAADADPRNWTIYYRVIEVNAT